MTFHPAITAARACTLCVDLPLGPKPVFQVHPEAKVLIIGQAPGTKAREAGVPFQDQSGKRLRDWLGVDHETFYDPQDRFHADGLLLSRPIAARWRLSTARDLCAHLAP